METAEILNKAADVIEERGWYQGLSQDPDGTGVCALGAICVAVGLDPHALAELGEGDDAAARAGVEAADALEDWLGLDLPVTQWNDEYVDTAEQVVTALREAAKAAEGGAS